MRCRSLVPFLTVVLSLGPSWVCAEPLIQTLPEDGDWVRFHVTLDIAGQATTPIWTLKSVGKKELAGAAYRWIELQSQENDLNVVLFKCLIAEAEFGKGKNPLASARQVFVKFGDQEPREFDSLAAADPSVAAILDGPAKAMKLDEKESVELQSGRIECDVFTGKSTSEFGTVRIEMTHRLLMSDKVPYGLAGAKYQFEADLPGQKISASVEAVFKESGKDAQSALPAIQ